jgi:hypothetical protein
VKDGHLRIGDAEREAASAALGDHLAQGRLDVAEHAERLDAVWTARTRADLAPVFADLPSTATSSRAGVVTSSRGDVRRPAGWRPAVPVALLLLVVLTALTHLPVVLLGLLAWWYVAHRHGVARPPWARHGK